MAKTSATISFCYFKGNEEWNIVGTGLGKRYCWTAPAEQFQTEELDQIVDMTNHYKFISKFEWHALHMKKGVWKLSKDSVFIAGLLLRLSPTWSATLNFFAHNLRNSRSVGIPLFFIWSPFETVLGKKKCAQLFYCTNERSILYEELVRSFFGRIRGHQKVLSKLSVLDQNAQFADTQHW